MGIAEAPNIVQADGIPVFSITAFNSDSAFPRITPCPQIIIGFLALFMSVAASCTFSESIAGKGL